MVIEEVLEQCLYLMLFSTISNCLSHQLVVAMLDINSGRKRYFYREKYIYTQLFVYT